MSKEEDDTRRIEEAFTLLMGMVDEAGKDLVRRAFEFACFEHQNNRDPKKRFRQSGDPYILHPLEVARQLAELRMDAHTLAAGLLHDVIEDCQVSPEVLRERFGPEITNLVQGVTKVSSINFLPEKKDKSEDAANLREFVLDEDAANLREFVLAMARDVRVVIIKLCDRLHNMRTLEFLDEKKRFEIANITLEIYAPLAGRLGMTRIKCELEDLCLFWLHPDDYREIERKIALWNEKHQQLHEDIKLFLLLYLRTQFPHIEISSRGKHFYSIWHKMKKQNLDFEEIYDITAVRILCNSIEECYAIHGMIVAIWTQIPTRYHDYISTPKPNGYQSLHTTVIAQDEDFRGEHVEIQIRTRKMHEVAEEGIAAHWRYKEHFSSRVGAPEQKLQWLSDLRDWIADLKRPGEFLEAIKTDVFSDIVVCLTPQGKVIDLPQGATPIDFAYAVHSGVGNTCVGARVNRRQVPLNTRLKTGDVVEIQTSKTTGHPSRDWLDIVATSRAKSKIMRWLKEKEFPLWVAHGRESVAQALKARNLTVTREALHNALEPIAAELRLSGVEDLFCEIGFGGQSVQKILNKAFPPEPQRERAGGGDSASGEAGAGAESDRARPRGPKSTPASAEALIEGGQGISVRLASCCDPQPGDAIVGFITRGRGVTVHRRNCPNIRRLRERGGDDLERLLPARWREKEEERFRNMKIRVVAEDRAGLLQELSGMLAEYGLFITGCSSRSNMRKATARFVFYVRVRNFNALNNAVKALRALHHIHEAAIESATPRPSRRAKSRDMTDSSNPNSPAS